MFLQKTRLKKLVPLGCLSILLTGMTLAWFSTRRLLSESSSTPAGQLAWEPTFGRLSPASTTPALTSLGPLLRRLTLPQVLSATEAVELGDTWVILDARLGKLHILPIDSGPVRSLGSEGPGPGEFLNPVSLAATDSSLWVLNQRGLVLDRYSRDGVFQHRIPLRGGGCRVGLAKGLSQRSSGEGFILRVCPSTHMGPGTAWVERVGAQGDLSPVLALPLGSPGSRRLHLLRQPDLEVGEDHMYLGTLDSPCIGVFTLSGTMLESRCLPEYPRPAIPSADRAKLQERFRGVIALGLLPIDIPEHLPWYDKMFLTEAGPVVRRLRGSEDRDLVLLRSRGRNVVVDTLLPEKTFVGSETVLAVQEVIQGSHIVVYSSPWR